MRQLQETREAGLRRLTAEMNDVLATMCPDEPGAPLTLTAFFSLDRAGPNLGFLSPASREKMTVAILARAQEGELEAGNLLETAKRVLSGEELADYTRWNAPATSALRNRLAGFDADEQEFTALLRWQEAAGSEREGAVARTELERQMGPERLAEWEQREEPAMKTALQDLRRLGLPLDQAGWLADFRSRAAVHLQQLWADPVLSDAQREAMVRRVHGAYRAEITTQLAAAADPGDLLP